MAEGYQADLALKEQYLGWGSTASFGNGLGFKEPDSSNLDLGLVQNRRSNKVRGQRFLLPDNVTTDYANPSGGFTIQPRAVEMLPLCMSFFQMVQVVNGTIIDGTAIGTYIFAPANKTPDSVGSSWGTWRSPAAAGGGGTNYAFNAADMYPVLVEQSFGTLTGADPTSQLRFQNGYVNTLEISQGFEEDMLFSPSFNFKGKSPGTENLATGGNFGTNYKSPSLRFAGWTATLSVDGTSNENLDVENITYRGDSKGQGRGRLGQYGFGRFTFTDDEHVIGMGVEFKDYPLYEKVLNDGSFAINIKWQVAGQSDWFQINAPAAKMRPVTPSLAGGDQTIEINYEAECFGVNGTPSVMFSVYAEYATSILSIDLAAGSSRAV